MSSISMASLEDSNWRQIFNSVVYAAHSKPRDLAAFNWNDNKVKITQL